MSEAGGGPPPAPPGGSGGPSAVQRGRPGRLAGRKQLPAEVEAHVREMIMAGQVKAGEFIRTERLAAELGISPTPVREGLLALRGEGFLALEPRRGFRVLQLRPSDIEDLFTAQAHLAGELAGRAAGELTAEQLDLLHTVQQRLVAAAAAGQIEAVEELNHEFHRIINKSANAPKLALLLSVAVRYVPRRFFALIEGYPEASCKDHEAILAALRARDASSATAAMHDHVLHAGRLLRNHLDAAHVRETG
ncbi:GntR family transcriptional regulator [Pseudonocardia sp.]|uniref:GntR family transcriptional regulator n=1 Tax=Pseudonocardia sp. TaxID=60912 RepID=UPI003D110E11